MTSALEGIRVVEFGQYIAAPLLGMLLADQGAEVIKVERPSGDPMRRHPAFQVWNRGKRSVVLDLKQREDLERAQTLAQGADVVVENFRPGVMERLGQGYEGLAVTNPGLVYVSLPGFGPSSPYRHTRGWETLVGAASAAYSGLNAPDTGGPVFTILPISSVYAAAASSPAVAAALFHRMRNGEGQRIETPLHNATFLAAGYYLVKAPGKGPAHFERGGYGAARPPVRTNGLFRCADGHYVSLAGGGDFLHRLLEVFGHPEWGEPILELMRTRDNPEEGRRWAARIEEMFASRPAREWEKLLGDAGVPMSMTRTIDEWLADPHAMESGAVVLMNDPVYGPMKQVGLQVRMSGTPGAIRGPAPALGQHTEEVLEGLPAAR